MANNTVDIKRKIIGQIRNKEVKAALKLFFKSFTDEKPTELEFVKNLYVELSKLSLHKDNFDLLSKVVSWYQDDIEFRDILENATKIYVDSLILQASNITFERLEKERVLEESLKRADSLTREKMQAENSKQLDNLNEKAKELYKLATKYSPRNITAYNGWLECSKISGDEKEIEFVKEKLKELSPSIREKVAALKGRGFEEQKKNVDYQSVSVDNDTFNEIKLLFNEKKFKELIEQVDKLNSALIIPVEILILKARALVELRRFKEADRTIFEAESLNTNFLDVKKLKEDVSAIKHKLYIKAGSIYLKKGIKLGVALGLDNFKKAKHCLMKALEINPDNLDLLDQAYSVFKYLGENDEAFKIKATIYSIEPTYKISYDSNYNQTLCFIATFAYKDEPWLINDFRWFRREYLLNTEFGRRLNSLYVLLSSKLTRVVLHKKPLKYLFKLILFLPLLVIKLLKILSGAQ